MKEEIAKKWVKALRSGKYKQGKQTLCRVNGKNVKYCCLGVLCHILGTSYKKDGNKKCYESETAGLPYSIMKKTGIKDHLGYFGYGTKDLADLNDEGKSFKQIADIIEESWKEL